jgi:hypothetical protein
MAVPAGIKTPDDIGNPDGSNPILEVDGEVLKIEPQGCRHRKGDLVCVLDAVHNILMTRHLGRTADGVLKNF